MRPRIFRRNKKRHILYSLFNRKWVYISYIPDVYYNKKNTKYTLNEVIENTIQAPSDRQVIIDNAVKKGIVGDGEDTLSISNYSTKKTNEKIRVIGDDVVDIKFDAELYKNSDRMSISVADDGTYTVTVKGLNSLTVK